MEFNLYGLITTCLVGAFLLGVFNEPIQQHGWFSQVMIVGVLSTLVALLPTLQEGISLNWGWCYLLMGLLILNTGILLGTSFLTRRFTQVMSRLAETLESKVNGLLHSTMWHTSKTVLMGLAKVLFYLSMFLLAIISMFCWAIALLTYPAREAKPRALPQGMGNQLAFS